MTGRWEGGHLFLTHLPLLQSRASGGLRGRGWGRGQPQQSREKTSHFVDHSKKRLRSPPSSRAFNLITAPHSPDRSGLQSELFTASSFCHRLIPHSPQRRRPGGPWPRGDVSAGGGGGPVRPPPPTSIPSSTQDHPSPAPKPLQSLEVAPRGAEGREWAPFTEVKTEAVRGLTGK